MRSPRSRVLEWRRTSPLLRPWPRSYLVAVTALVTGVAAYAIGWTGAERTPDPEPGTVTVSPESWIVERTHEPIGVSPVGDELFARAAGELPEGVDPGAVVTLMMVGGESMYNYYGGELVALEDGTYDIYVTCEVDEEDVAQVFIDNGITLDLWSPQEVPTTNIRVPCPGRHHRSPDPLKLQRTAAMSVSVTPYTPDPESPEYGIWETNFAAVVYLVKT